jgi:hypothetical protein
LEQSPTPFAQYQHPNPTRRIVAYSVDALGTPRLLFDAPADPFRPVDVATYEFVGSVQSDERPAASLSLAQNEAAAFKQTDWVVPQRKRNPHEGISFSARMATLLEPIDVTHRLPTYAPRPFRGQHAVYSGTERSSYTPLIDSPSIPFSIYDWPTHRRPDRIEAHTIHVVRYESPLPDPFGQKVWPTPPRKKAVEVQNFPSATLGPLGTAVIRPFAELRWPTPDRRVARFQETPQPNLQGLLYVIAVKPFTQSDWPTAWPRVGRFDGNRTNLMLVLPPPPIPFNLTEWPNPLRKTDPHFDVWGQSLQHTTLFVENVKPFNQNDWNFAYLFEARLVTQFLTVNSKLLEEGFGSIGLQPPFSVVGLMTEHGVSVYGALSLRGLSVDGPVTETHAVDGSFDPSEGHEGLVT